MADITASAGDVGAVLRARTKDVNGNELGAFTPDTRPTGTQVDAMVADARFAVEARVGVVPDELADAGRRVVALGAALLVELSFFPEQVATGRSPYDQLRALYEQRLEALATAIGELGAGGDVGPGDDAGVPRWSFDERSLIGPRSVL